MDAIGAKIEIDLSEEDYLKLVTIAEKIGAVNLDIAAGYVLTNYLTREAERLTKVVPMLPRPRK